MSQAPTLINLPPPPSDPLTPSDVPGTPNSATTSMSELSTVAIKDGHRGHLPHPHHPLDAERADRISRLAGLERVATARQAGAAHAYGAAAPSNATSAYFDANNQPQITRERSTVGSASATGSVGGRTTWASGSDGNDADKMSEDQEVDTSSVGGMSDETPSLVGFGEGARTPARAHSSYGSPAVSKVSAVPQHLRDQTASPMSGVSSGANSTGVGSSGNPGSTVGSGGSATAGGSESHRQDARMIDGMTYDDGVVDTANRTPPIAHAGLSNASAQELSSSDRRTGSTRRSRD